MVEPKIFWLGLDRIFPEVLQAAILVALACIVEKAVAKLISVAVFASQTGLFEAETAVPQVVLFELILIFGVEA